jgi:ribosome maturation protein Sdo1
MAETQLLYQQIIDGKPQTAASATPDEINAAISRLQTAMETMQTAQDALYEVLERLKMKS